MKKLLTALFIVLSFVSAAHATSVFVVGTGYGNDIAVSFTDYEGKITTTGLFAGELLLSWNEFNSDMTFAAYCLSLNDSVLLMDQPVNIRPLSQLPDMDNPFGAQPDSGSKLAWLLNYYGPEVDTNDSGAGLAVALWEVLYDSSYDLLAGNFFVPEALGSIDDSTRYSANLILETLGSNTDEAFWLDTDPIFNTTLNFWVSQDLGIPGSSSLPNPVPEPGSFALLGSGILVLGLIARRKQNY